MADAANAQQARRGVNPLLSGGVGTIMLIFWIVAILLQVQTSEAFLLQGPVVSYSPNWSILLQIPNLIMGQLTPDMAKAALWGWGNELVYLVCVVGYEIAHEQVSRSSKKLASWFRTIAVALVVFDSWADFKYGNLASGFWGQIGFAVMTAFIVAFFGVIGLKFIESAFAEIRN